jgi:hypothetical protein
VEILPLMFLVAGGKKIPHPQKKEEEKNKKIIIISTFLSFQTMQSTFFSLTKRNLKTANQGPGLGEVDFLLLLFGFSGRTHFVWINLLWFQDPMVIPHTPA